jgi:hypothetical protein
MRAAYLGRTYGMMPGRRRYMTAIDDLQDATVLNFQAFSFHLQLPVLGDRDSTSDPLCLTKARGWVLEIPARSFGLPTPLMVRFVGRAVDSSTVVWEVDQTLRDVSVFGIGVSHIGGMLTTTVSSTALTRGNSCDGGSMNTLFTTSLATIPSQCRVVASTALGEAILTNVSTEATVGEPLPALAFNVNIHASRWERDGCGHFFQLEHTSVDLTALVSHVSTVGTATPMTFAWTASGIDGLPAPADQRTCRVTFGAAGEASVSVRVTTSTDLQGEVSSFATLTFSVLTADELSHRRQECRLRGLVAGASGSVITLRGVGAGFTRGRTRFVDPLWDPTPDGALAAMNPGTAARHSLADLHQLRTTADAIGKAASALSRTAEKIIAVREKELTATIKKRNVPTPPKRPK